MIFTKRNDVVVHAVSSFYIRCSIGLWVAPDPEKLEQAYLAYYKAMLKRKKKTA